MKRTPTVTIATSCGYGGMLYRYAQPAVDKMALGGRTEDLTDQELLALCLVLQPDYLVSGPADPAAEAGAPKGNPMLDMLCVDAGAIGEESQLITTRCPVEVLLVDGLVQVRG